MIKNNIHLFMLLLGIFVFSHTLHAQPFTNSMPFTGTSYVEIPHISAYNYSKQWTLETWVRTDTILSSNWQALISKEAVPNRPPSLWIYENVGEVWFTPNERQIGSDSTIKTGVWTHYAAVFDSLKLSVYFNGKFIKETLTTSLPDTNTANLFLGQRGDNLFFLYGSMQETRVWRVARTATQIASAWSDSLRASTYTSPDSGLVGYWRLNDWQNGTVIDYSINKNNGTVKNFGVASARINESKALGFELSQNFPNPFNPSTVIRYNLAERATVNLVVYDALGRVVTTLVNSAQPAGRYEIPFQAGNLSSGVYFYKLTAGNFTSTKKMVLIK
ncbi:MAG: LamG-like jellyroll fold domain-containing protein [Chloroherpetonaceae bacterium]|nr:LamG-like jellyroll fold domain-containing protein [Chloroherpetonaceae bacterium]